MVYLNLTLLQSSDLLSHLLQVVSVRVMLTQHQPLRAQPRYFSASSGVVVNSTTGEADIAATGLGAHTITYSVAKDMCGLIKSSH